MRQKLIPVAICTALSWAALGAAAREPDAFQVVVHPSNASPALLASEVSRIFLKQRSSWPHDETLAVDPVDLNRDSAVREAFSQRVHGKSAAAISSQWLRAMVAGTGVGPQEKGSDAEVLAYVRANPGAVGYVAAAAPIGDARQLPILTAKPKVVEKVLPRYTEQAMKLKIEARVTLLVTVGADGDVARATAIEARDPRGRDLGSARGLARAAEKAVQAWRYEPATWRGQPIEACFEETVNFSL